jgi:hypothetical protein
VIAYASIVKPEDGSHAWEAGISRTRRRFRGVAAGKSASEEVRLEQSPADLLERNVN